MNKSAIQKFAIWARTTLMEQVAQRAYQYGITQDGYGEENAITVNGMALSPQEQSQRRELVREIQAKGYDQVVEEVAYTWFNRFIALRYMEVNNYLPSHIRVFSNAQGAFDPEILKEALHIDLPGLDQSRVAEYIEKNETEALYRYLLLTQCNALNEGLPKMFEKMGGYTELLFPNNILRPDSVLGRMVADIPEEDWTDQVQIIGWLYQYYNTELKAETFDLLKKNVKITKERIPSATQLFTPDWIVRYMVENSLGRLWLDHLQAETEVLHPIGSPKHDPQNINSYHHAEEKIDSLRKNWHYYVDEAPQEQDVAWELAVQRQSVEDLRLEDIKIIDPCMGSGHILVYAFDVLMQLYESAGWSQRDAAVSIVQNNLYGLDIDDRAFQLAYFAVMMKARQYNRRIFSKPVRHHLYSIQESNEVNRAHLAYLGADLSELEKNDATNQMIGLLDALRDAKTFGSLLCLRALNWELLHRFAAGTEDVGQMSFEAVGTEQTCTQLQTLLEIAEVLARQYDVVVTNPPYMAVSNGDAALNKYIKDNYPDSKGDLFAAFIERCGRFARQNGYQAMITQHAWMFLSSFEKLRTKLLQSADIVNMAHLGARAFEEIGGEVVQTTSFVLRRAYTRGYKSTYCRLVEPTTQQGKEDMFLAGENRYTAEQASFFKIPGLPIAYWLSKKIIDLLSQEKTIGNTYESGSGLSTADNDRFLRFFWEVDRGKTATTGSESQKWYLFQKGGEYRKWYGNLVYVVNWEDDGAEIKHWVTHNPKDPDTKSWSRRIFNTHLYFQSGVTWSVISSGSISFRATNENAMISNAAGGIFGFVSEQERDTFMAALNTKIWSLIFSTINPTLNYSSGVIQKAPLPILPNTNLGVECVKLSKNDWDSYETSWDFKRHPLLSYGVSVYSGLGDGSNPPTAQFGIEKSETLFKIFEKDRPHAYTVRSAFDMWNAVCEKRFQQLKANEEELNRIFIDIYGLQDEITPEVADKDVTVHRIFNTRDDVPESMKGSNYVRTLRDEIISLISYAVGCLFGRYSIYRDGLIYAGGNFNEQFELHQASTWGDLEQLGWSGLDQKTFRQLEKPYYYLKGQEVPPALGIQVDADNILPICDDDYFEDDLTGKFVDFIRVVYGEDTLEENLKFIADALGGKGTPREVIRSYFINDFFADHCKTYQKRPIYWLFDSGKKNGFKALIYLHRYQRDLLARMRTDYVHEQQERYRTQLSHLADALEHASGADKVRLTKQQKKLQDQSRELQTYEEKIHHLADQNIELDLDDGVKVNYAKFGDVLAKIK